MKKISILTSMLIICLSVIAQDNKPGAGSFGIGYNVVFLPTEQHINFTYFVTNNIEVGGALGLGFSHNRNSTYDSTVAYTGAFTALPANEEKRTVTNSTSFTIEPLVKYHFKVKNNLDVYVGGNLPIGVSSGSKTILSDIITATDYNSTSTVTTTPPVTVSVGLSGILGCQYFFYQNLAIGAEANVGFTASVEKGYETTKTGESNTGTNNPSTGTTYPSDVTKVRVNTDNITLGMLHRFSIGVTWYFGNKSK